ncbi:hypothetical protein PR048_019489 [Dryococelus australis]|uniref:Branched-chain-amino-acid aminotransferase n=1 Tax=Dryococelus australis TaxID=614101 RepID=A0ABQ9H3P5_9NEOP|nr:hypothetical protein PR048_019489 [Dryococelus australis]
MSSQYFFTHSHTHYMLFSDLAVRLAGPHQLQPKPETNALQFGQNFTDHMLKIHYYETLGGWQRPEIVPMESIVLHPAAKVLHYAVELFEGMKAYRGRDNKIRIFRPQLNMARMNVTAVRAGLPTFDGDELIKCLCRLVNIDQEWVPHSEASSLYIRPTLIGIDVSTLTENRAPNACSMTCNQRRGSGKSKECLQSVPVMPIRACTAPNLGYLVCLRHVKNALDY